MSRQRPAYDCTACGACCCNPDENRVEGYVDYVEVKPNDELLKRKALVHRLVVLGRDGVPHMRMQHHRCAALKGPVGEKAICTIYEVRPTPCRRLEAGSERCLEYRRERGVDG